MSKDLIEQLKVELVDKVLVGDFLGNKDLINIIEYPREVILFHNVVSKSKSTETARENAFCLLNGQEILQKYQLDHIPLVQCGVFSDYDLLCDQLEQIYREAAASSISVNEEGFVIQLVQRDHPT